MMNAATEPKVSVSVICFNQAELIAETLEGILSQEADFAFEIVISDDASTDGTQEIISEYREKFPTLIRTYASPLRQGMKENFLNNLTRCKGPFIAFCDGDDLWTDPRKLQLQADFLELNTDFATVFHRVRHESARGHLFQELPKAHMRKFRLTAGDLVSEGAFMPTSSIMFRKPADGLFPKWFRRMENIVDLPLNIYNALQGDIGYIDETLGIYRTASSAHASSARPVAVVLVETSRMYEIMIENFPSALSHGLRAHQRKVLRQLFLVHTVERQPNNALAVLQELKVFREAHGFEEFDSFDYIAPVTIFFTRLHMYSIARWVGQRVGSKFLP